MNGWIPVNERLPEPFETVLISIKSRNGYGEPAPIVEIGGYDCTKDEWESYTAPNKRLADGEVVVGWQPLPEPMPI